MKKCSYGFIVLEIFALFSFSFSGCQLASKISVAATSTPNFAATVKWIVDDAVMGASTQIMYTVNQRFESISLTETAAPEPQKEVKPELVSSPVFTATITNTSIPSAQETQSSQEMKDLFPCIDKMKFIKDVTIPDNTIVEAGKPFTKTWQIKNSGTCTWDQSYHLVFQKGDRMSAKTKIDLPESVSVKPDDTIEISIYMIAPEKSGQYAGYWMMEDPKGNFFGTGENYDKAIWVKVRVK